MRNFFLKILVFLLLITVPTIAQEPETEQPEESNTMSPQVFIGDDPQIELLGDGDLLMRFSIDFEGIIIEELNTITFELVEVEVIPFTQVEYDIKFFQRQDGILNEFTFPSNEISGRFIFEELRKVEEGPLNISFAINNFCESLFSIIDESQSEFIGIAIDVTSIYFQYRPTMNINRNLISKMILINPRDCY